jgi:hypothetical protein
VQAAKWCVLGVLLGGTATGHDLDAQLCKAHRVLAISYVTVSNLECP